MVADRMVIVGVVMHGNWVQYSVWVPINAAIEPRRMAHAGTGHGWAVPALGGVGGGCGVAFGRVVGVVAGVEEGGVWSRMVVRILACWSHR